MGIWSRLFGGSQQIVPAPQHARRTPSAPDSTSPALRSQSPASPAQPASPADHDSASKLYRKSRAAEKEQKKARHKGYREAADTRRRVEKEQRKTAQKAHRETNLARTTQAEWQEKPVSERTQSVPANPVAPPIIPSKADHGDAEAQVELGFRYAQGNGVVKDAKKALECFYRAADQQYADAQGVLGTIFHEGLWGLQTDYQEALTWHRLAADQGWVPSLLSLGLMYDNGRGVPEDGREAFKWFRAALVNGRGGSTHAHTEELEKLLAMFLVRIAEACSGSRSYDYLSSYDQRRDFAQEIGTLLYHHGGMRAMKRALDEYVGKIPGQRTIDQFWDGIGDWSG